MAYIIWEPRRPSGVIVEPVVLLSVPAIHLRLLLSEFPSTARIGVSPTPVPANAIAPLYHLSCSEVVDAPCSEQRKNSIKLVKLYMQRIRSIRRPGL